MIYLWIALGGALGALSRFGLSVTMSRFVETHFTTWAYFPWATLIINVLGSFAIGMLWVWLTPQHAETEPYRLLFITGFLGAFTTFSSFSLESIMLLQQGRGWGFALYAGGSLITCLIMTALGIWLAKQFV